MPLGRREGADSGEYTDGRLRLRRSFDGKAGPIQKFVKAVGDSLTLRAIPIVVEEDNGGIFCPLVGSGDPIPRAAARGCETKSGT